MCLLTRLLHTVESYHALQLSVSGPTAHTVCTHSAALSPTWPPIAGFTATTGEASFASPLDALQHPSFPSSSPSSSTSFSTECATRRWPSTLVVCSFVCSCVIPSKDASFTFTTVISCPQSIERSSLHLTHTVCAADACSPYRINCCHLRLPSRPSFSSFLFMLFRTFWEPKTSPNVRTWLLFVCLAAIWATFVAHLKPIEFNCTLSSSI